MEPLEVLDRLRSERRSNASQRGQPLTCDNLILKPKLEKGPGYFSARRSRAKEGKT